MSHLFTEDVRPIKNADQFVELFKTTRKKDRFCPPAVFMVDFLLHFYALNPPNTRGWILEGLFRLLDTDPFQEEFFDSIQRFTSWDPECRRSAAELASHAKVVSTCEARNIAMAKADAIIAEYEESLAKRAL